MGNQCTSKSLFPMANIYLLFQCTTFFNVFSLLFSLATPNELQRPAPPPANDDCANPTEIVIPNDGYNLGAIQSELTDLREATIQFGEYFDPVQVSAVNDKKSVWYRFTLPTHRELKVELFQPGNTIPAGDAGFTIYLADECLPGVDEISLAKLTPVNKFGASYHPCLSPGNYLVQVSARTTSNGPIFLELTLGNTFTNDNTDEVPFDLTSDAYDFGLVNSRGSNTSYDWGCHSVDGEWEFNCLPTPNADRFKQSIWHIFSTDNFVDLVSIKLGRTRNSTRYIPDSVGIQVLEGDVRNVSNPQTLNEVACGFFSISRQPREADLFEIPCMLSPNNTYSFSLLLPENYFSENMQVEVFGRGQPQINSAVPNLNLLPQNNQLGILPQNETVTYQGNFSCNNRLSLPQNQCDSVNTVDYVIIRESETDSSYYDLVEWITFEITETSDVSFNNSSNSIYSRLFKNDLNNGCAGISIEEDLVYQYFRQGRARCLDPGIYSLQILSYSQSTKPRNWPTSSYWYSGSLGKTTEIKITALPLGGSKFDLKDAQAIDRINDLNPLQDKVAYQTEEDIFSCANSALPDSMICEPARMHAIYRTFIIGDANGDARPDSGMLILSDIKAYLDYNRTTPDIRYNLFKSDIEALAAAQNAYGPDARIIRAGKLLA